jgi:hypothetical protein
MTALYKLMSPDTARESIVTCKVITVGSASTAVFTGTALKLTADTTSVEAEHIRITFVADSVDDSNGSGGNGGGGGHAELHCLSRRGVFVNGVFFTAYDGAIRLCNRALITLSEFCSLYYLEPASTATTTTTTTTMMTTSSSAVVKSRANDALSMAAGALVTRIASMTNRLPLAVIHGVQAAVPFPWLYSTAASHLTLPPAAEAKVRILEAQPLPQLKRLERTAVSQCILELGYGVWPQLQKRVANVQRANNFKGPPHTLEELQLVSLLFVTRICETLPATDRAQISAVLRHWGHRLLEAPVSGRGSGRGSGSGSGSDSDSGSGGGHSSTRSPRSPGVSTTASSSSVSSVLSSSVSQGCVHVSDRSIPWGGVNNNKMTQKSARRIVTIQSFRRRLECEVMAARAEAVARAAGADDATVLASGVAAFARCKDTPVCDELPVADVFIGAERLLALARANDGLRVSRDCKTPVWWWQ